MFNTSGRGLRVYRASLKKVGPRIGRDEITDEFGCEMVLDLRAMCAYILHNYCMWLPSPGDVPRPYSLSIVGQFFDKGKEWARRANRRASDLLLSDPHFQALFNQVSEDLQKQGFKVVQRPR